MRKLSVHPEIASLAFCHHWTQRAPSLPIIEEKILEVSVDRQLELGREVMDMVRQD